MEIKYTYCNKFKKLFIRKSRFGFTDTSYPITDEWKLDSYAGKHALGGRYLQSLNSPKRDQLSSNVHVPRRCAGVTRFNNN